MEFEGTYKFIISKRVLWSHLNNPETIKFCIEGCKDFKELKENHFDTKVSVKLGPVNATFGGSIKLIDIHPFDKYTIEASGNAGQLGFAKGTVKINLSEEGQHTILKYKAKTEISGKIAQLGSRLIEGSVKKNSDKFFSNLSVIINKKDLELDASKNQDKRTDVKLKNNFVIFFFIIIFIMIAFFIN